MQRALRYLAAVLAVGIVAAACGGTSPQTAASPAATAAGTAAAGATAAATPDPIQALKAKVQGKSIVLGAGSPPNLAEVTTRKAANILQETFGVTIDYKPIAATTLAAGVLSGSIHAAEVSLTRLAGLKEGGADITIFGTNDFKLDYVLIAKTSIKTVQELKGRTYVSGGNTGSSALFNNYCFGQAGMTTNDVKQTALSSSSAINTAILGGQFESAMVHADLLAQLNAKQPGQWHALCYTYKGVNETNDVWFSTAQWVKDNPDMALAITIAKTMAARWTYDKKDEWVTLAKSYVPNLEPGVAESTYDLFARQIGLWSVNSVLTLASCAADMDQLVKVGRIKVAPDCKTFVNLDYEKRALEILGKAPEPKVGN